MVKHTSLGHHKFFLLWAVDEKLISIIAVVGHKLMFLNQDEGQYVRYSLGVIPDRILISRKVTNCFGVCHSYVTMYI